MTHLILIACSFFTQTPSQESPASSPRVHKIAVGGEGGWDYLTVDPGARRLYVSRGNRVVVLDLDKEMVVGELADTPGVHGIAIVPELGKGFTSNGSDSSVTVFDLKTLKATGKIKARGVPDAILYDAASKRVLTFNHSTNDGTVIDPAAEKVVGTIDFGGEPEAAVADGKGRIFVNIRSSSEIAEFDPLTLKMLNRWSLAPGQRPNGLAIDAKNRRLFSGCNGNSQDGRDGRRQGRRDRDGGHRAGLRRLRVRPGEGARLQLQRRRRDRDGHRRGRAGEVPGGRDHPDPGDRPDHDPRSDDAPALPIGRHPDARAGRCPAETKGGRRGNVPGSFVIIVVGD